MMKEAFDRSDRKLDEISDETKVMDQHVTSLEHGARQPRLAMEADGPVNTKPRERTEGATIAVQAMRGDRCTTEQKVQDGPKTSISFGMMAEPPDLPCREDVLVEDGATAPESYLSSLEMRSPTAAGGLVPTGEASTATEIISNEPLLRFYATKETNPKEKNHGLRLHTPRTTAASSRRVTCLLLPTAGGSLRQNPGKIGLFIQAVCKVISAPARFGDRGTCWFVVRLYELGQLVMSCSVFRTRLAAFLKQGQPKIRCAGKTLAVEGGLRLHELEGGTEVTPSCRLEVIGS